MNTFNEFVKAINEDVNAFDENVKAINEDVNAFDENVKAIDEVVNAFSEFVKAIDEDMNAFNEFVQAINEEVNVFDENVKAIDEDVKAFNEFAKAIDEFVKVFSEEFAFLDLTSTRMKQSFLKQVLIIGNTLPSLALSGIGVFYQYALAVEYHGSVSFLIKWFPFVAAAVSVRIAIAGKVYPGLLHFTS